MVDPQDAVDQDTGDQDGITREQVQDLWKDSRNWVLWVIYSCREDPRVIVGNRFFVGWTWNFGHPQVFRTMGAGAAFGSEARALRLRSPS